MAAELNITGLEEMDRALRVLPDRIARRVLANATRAGARVIRDAAKRNVPRRTGRGQDSIRVAGKRLRGGSYRATVGVRLIGRRSDAYYLRFLEGGANPHVIRARRVAGRGSPRGWLSFGGTVRRTVRHPGVRPRRWLSRAAESGSQPAVDAFARRLWAGVERELGKLQP